MKSNPVSNSTQSFGINERSSIMSIKQKRYVALFFAGILVAVLIGFLLGYFIPKCDDTNSKVSCPNNRTTSNESKHYEEQLVSLLDSKTLENISR